MMNHPVHRVGACALLCAGLVACGGGGGDGRSTGVGGNSALDDMEDSGPPMTPGEMSNAGDSTLTDGDPVDEMPNESAESPEPPPVEQPADDAAQGGLESIAGLWDDSFTYPDGRVNITYLEITSDGRYINHDYRGDSFDLGENCYETIEGMISTEADGLFRAMVLGEEFRFEAVAINGQLQVSFPEGGSTTLAGVTGLSTADFNEC